MRPHLREFLELCARTLACSEPIVEIGAFQVSGQEAIADLRPLFPGKNYIGCDMRPGVGVDRIEDIHHRSFGSGEVGTFILGRHARAGFGSTRETRTPRLPARRSCRNLQLSDAFSDRWERRLSRPGECG
jgi:hypothetical protein